MQRYLIGSFLLAPFLVLAPAMVHASQPQMACNEIYQPVCGSHQVQCFAAPCYPVYETYPNSCFMQIADATLIHTGECRAGETGPIKPVVGTGYTPPPGCTAWFDGCNSCGVNKMGATFCTMRACLGTPAAGYCTSYESSMPQPASSTPDASATSSIATTTAVAPHIGFFAWIWNAILSLFR